MSKKPTYEELEKRNLELERIVSEIKLNFERAQKISRIGSWDWDPLTDKVTYTDMIFDIFGLNENDFEGNFASILADLVHPDDRVIVQEAAEKAQASGVGSDVIYRIIRPDGEIRWIHALGEYIFKDGQIVKMIGTNQDVTEHKLAETSLQESENLYHVLTENTSLGIGVSKGLEMIYANQSILDMFKIDSIDGFNEKPPLEYLTSESKKRVRDRIDKQARSEKITDDLIIDIIRSDDELRTLELYLESITFKGESCRLITFNDITEKKKTEEALILSEERFRTVVTNSLPIIFMLDIEGNIILSEGKMLNIVGLVPGQLVGQNVFEIYKDFPVLINAFRSTLNGEEFRGVVDFGGLFFESFYSPNRNSSGEIIGVIGISMDITSQKKSEEEKLEFEKNLLQTQKLESLGVLAGGIAHDFNNILMGILGYAGLALSELSPFSPAREYVQGINDSSKKAAGLIKQMLAYSGKGKFSLEPINLNHMIGETIEMLKISISKNVILKFNLSDEPIFLEGDPSQIRQVIMNLVINASEAIGERDGVIALDAGVKYCDRNYIDATGFEDQIANIEKLKEGMYVFLEISDTGIGMSKETISKIFEPFYTTKFTGRGLGLSAVLGIIGGHHGMVKIYSEENKGSCFKILFPQFESDQSIKSSSDPFNDLENNWQGKGTFLIADDEETVRDVGEHMLQTLGFDVLTACDGKEAIEIFTKHHEEIVGILLDLTMPYKNGAEVFQVVRQLNPKVRVILTSGYNEQSATQQFIGKGLAGFIQKPYDISELIKKIKEVMNKVK